MVIKKIIEIQRILQLKKYTDTVITSYIKWLRMAGISTGAIVDIRSGEEERIEQRAGKVIPGGDIMCIT